MASQDLATLIAKLSPEERLWRNLFVSFKTIRKRRSLP